ncbi:MAG: hypothetical protein HFH38_12180 [Lachnospiraceae bacterium]|jgi:hypothetical protein|nr:hypothetical protein [Lachnospiraceae bacterium]
MSVQDKIEHIFRSFHLLFSTSELYKGDESKVIVEKQKVFQLLEQLNLAVYEAMDQYEVTRQKHQMAERRCEKRGEEIIMKASRHADDIYAASIMYTDDAINRICHIMEDANESIKKTLGKANMEIEGQRQRVRRNQLELTGQLRDFADVDKYVKMIEEVNKQLERERRLQLEGREEKRIQNEGKAYAAVKPEIKVNQAYFERMGIRPELERRDGASDSLARVTGKEFAEGLRRRAARKRQEGKLEIEDMSAVPEEGQPWEAADTGLGWDAMPEMEEAPQEPGGFGMAVDPYGEEADIPPVLPEIHVNLDAEYFRWKDGEGDGGQEEEEKKERHFPFKKR